MVCLFAQVMYQTNITINIYLITLMVQVSEYFFYKICIYLIDTYCLSGSMFFSLKETYRPYMYMKLHTLLLLIYI